MRDEVIFRERAARRAQTLDRDSEEGPARFKEKIKTETETDDFHFFILYSNFFTDHRTLLHSAYLSTD